MSSAISKKSCLRCSKFISCRDKNKSATYSCSSYTKLKEIESFDSLDAFMDIVPNGEVDPDIELFAKNKATLTELVDLTPGMGKLKKTLDIVADKRLQEALPDEIASAPRMGTKEIDYAKIEDGDFIWQAMQEAYDPLTNSVRDVKIDDRDMRLGENYYDFCTKVAGKAIKKPFSRQLYIALNLLNEYCPRCTNPKWLDLANVPVDMDSQDLARKVVMMKHGRCPKCGVTKAQLILEKELKDYNELALIMGQRASKCAQKRTILLTSEGLKTFGELDKLHYGSKGKLGFVPYEGPALIDKDGKKVMPSHFYRAGVTPTLKVTTSIGQELVGTYNHPIWTSDGYIELQNLRVGQEIPLYVGQQSFGKDYLRMEDLLDPEYCERKEIIGKRLTPALARFLAYFVAEGSTTKALTSGEITNTDPNIYNHCINIVKKISGEQPRVATDSRCLEARRVVMNAEFMREVMNPLTDGIALDPVKRKSAYRTVPSCILRSPRPVVQSFLRALFEGDGCVDTKKATVKYTSLSKNLIRQVHLLMLNLGVPCTVRSYMYKATNGSDSQTPVRAYSIMVGGLEGLTKFKALVGFESARKNAQVDSHLDYLNKATTHKDPGIFGYCSKEQSDALCRMYNYINSLFVKYRILNPHKVRATVISIRTGWKIRLPRPMPGAEPLATRYNARQILEVAQDPMVWKLLTKEDKIRVYQLKEQVNDLNTYYIRVTSIKKDKEQETFDVNVPKVHRFMADGLLNHNSSFASTLSADMAHRFIKAPRLSSICAGIQEFTPLTATFVALTASRAIKLLWNPFIAIIDSSSWFQDYFSMLRSYGRKYDRELYKKTGLYLHFHHKNLAFYPSPPMKKTLRGDTRFLAATDELSFFAFNPNRSSSDLDEAEDERERADGPEVQASLANSLATVRTEVYNLYKKNISIIPQGLNLNMSSPASKNDTLCVIERDSHHPDSLTFGLKLPTWEVNPMYSRDHPIIVEAYRKNPVKAERDFGANPPEMSSSLYTAETVAGMFRKGQVNSHKVLLVEHASVTMGKVVHIVPQKIYYPAVMAIDAGLVNNSFAFCVGYREDTKFIVHTVGELIPKPGKQIHFPSMYSDILLPMAKQLNVCVVGADRWNSITTLQQFEQDVPTIKHIQNMLRYSDFAEFTTSAQSGDIWLPELELPMERILVVQDYKKELANTPIAHLALQLHTVRDTGTSVVKGDGYTDDMFRTVVLAHKLAFNAKTKSHLNKSKVLKMEADSDKSRSRILVGGRSLINLRRS